MYAYVVKPHPLRDGGFKISKPRGPEGWGIYNFKNPGALRGGGFAFSWGNPNTICDHMRSFLKNKQLLASMTS